MTPRNKYDWEAIFKDYRAGIITVREVARKHNVDASYMTRQCKKHKIERDLTQRVRQSVSQQLVHKAVHSESVKDDESIVRESAKTVVNVVEIHRKDILVTRALEQSIMTKLAKGTKPVMRIVNEKRKEVDEPLTPIEESVALNNLANVQTKRINLERQAYGLNDLNDPNSNLHTVESIVIDPGDPNAEEYDG